MTERVLPNEKSLDRAIRTHVRQSPTLLNEPPTIISASVEFATAAYYSSKGIGDPEKHDAKAIRSAQSLGLTEENLLRARTFGTMLFAQYANPKSEKVMRALEEFKASETIRKAEQERLSPLERTESGIKREQKEIELRERFRNLMEAPIEKLRIEEANDRIKIWAHPIYKSARDEALRKKIRSRTLTREEYFEAIGNTKEIEDPIQLNTPPLNDHESEELLSTLSRYMNNSREFRQKFKDNTTVAMLAIFALAKGDFVSGAFLRENSIDPQEVIFMSRKIKSNFRLDKIKAKTKKSRWHH